MRLKKAIQSYTSNDYKMNFFRVPGLATALLLATTSSFAAVNYVPSGSMLPTVQLGALLAVNKLSYGLRIPLTQLHLTAGEQPVRGDIATFTPLGSRFDTHVKRIVAIPGDSVRMQNGILSVNGEVLSAAPALGLQDQSWLIGAGEVFMAGDNAGNSNDSRLWGPLPSSRLTGKVVGILNTFKRHHPAD